MRPKYVIGNWKMFTSISEGRKLAEEVHKFAQLHVAGSNVRVAVCPPFTHLTEVAHVLKESLVKLGAQDCHFENEGAHTGTFLLSCSRERERSIVWWATPKGARTTTKTTAS
ncbi:MAG: triose-phosphate isomerase [Candidatus Iainarchaeum archaeon]|uniref:Triose-phosphate isomerase n=1 Tax=Candidatus Iainarchaeum sp. TaxID=3101447 RepID=A0A7T9DJ36_9ARCH|nr:MAG: triose-phosphate isomerase [Candidatus Diapherotrites archaeon]